MPVCLAARKVRFRLLVDVLIFLRNVNCNICGIYRALPLASKSERSREFPISTPFLVLSMALRNPYSILRDPYGLFVMTWSRFKVLRIPLALMRRSQSSADSEYLITTFAVLAASW